jgi:2-furoyl-CoA dehydrogenase 2Fe-2S iron sulfur subunit
MPGPDDGGLKPAGQRQVEIALAVNGRTVRETVEPRLLLTDFLRHRLGLTGTHVGCEHGVCGACTVLLDGVSVRGCCVLAVQADGSTLETVESLAGADGLSQLQEAFRRHHALQCGFCTPGILMAATDFLDRRPNPTRAEVEDLLSGHLCRCTGYAPIVDAILDVSRPPDQSDSGSPGGRST